MKFFNICIINGYVMRIPENDFEIWRKILRRFLWGINKKEYYNWLRDSYNLVEKHDEIEAMEFKKNFVTKNQKEFFITIIYGRK